MLACMIRPFALHLAIVVLSVSHGVGQEPAGTVARPERFSYADPAGGRAGYRLAGEPVNEARLYDFYQRQADYYMGMPAANVPALLPAYPGLDAGLHGHWGKHNQNNHEDGRWNEMDHGSLLTQVFVAGEVRVLKGISVKLGDGVSACFDPQALSYRAVWTGDFVSFHPFRWGTSRNATLSGDPWFVDPDGRRPDENARYRGFYRLGNRVAFAYSLGHTRVLDTPGLTSDGCFSRSLRLSGKGEKLRLRVGFGGSLRLIAGEGISARLRQEQDRWWLEMSEVAEPSVVSLVYAREPEHDLGADPPAPAFDAFLAGGQHAWPETVQTVGELGEGRPNSAYVTDTLTVPYENPFRSVMQLSGIAFDAEGTAYVTTLPGEVWSVTGIDGDLDQLIWKRFASGFNQPMGIRIDPDGMFVLDRGQITRLHDLNNDGEADFYENYANDFGGYDRSHSHTFGLHRTADGTFHFTQRESILRTNPDGKTELQGSGVRNCMGIGGSADYFWVAPQEGNWTPASSIIEVNRGEFYGLPNKDAKLGTSIATALCYIPRGVDNSVGGMLEITSDKWGPYRGAHVGLSYGSGLHYLIHRDTGGTRPQGAVVPLEAEFLAGTVRGAFHPVDGQLYAVGLDGWGDYSVRDGCFHRVRYRGGAVHKPSGFRVHRNGIRIEFPVPLEPDAASLPSNYFAHAWNYQYASRYGSPEFSARKPESVGHDYVPVRSVSVLNGGRAVFVEMPEMEPVMQIHIRTHLKSAAGIAFRTDLFASPMYPADHLSLPGVAAPAEGKPSAIALPVARDASAVAEESGEPLEGARELLVEAIGGLQYKQKELRAKPGEPLALRLENTDVMPHNLVIVGPGAAKTVGAASFAMLNDPDAGKKSYVPDLEEVIVHTPVINPGKRHVLHFRAPAKPGRYPYICTFPGHWQAMQGVLIVDNE